MRGIWGGNHRIKFTADGGLAVQYYNKTGADSIKGYVVQTSGSVADSVVLNVVNEPDPIGVFLDSGVPDGQLAWVVVSGRAYVWFIASTTLNYLARTFLTGESGAANGKAMAEAKPTPSFATDKHFCEIGHVLEARTGAGLALVNLHFN